MITKYQNWLKSFLNMGVGEASHNSKIAEAIEAQLTKIAGQKQ